MTTGCLIVFTTCPDADAARVARALVEEGLAACVNILPPMQSVYRWEGAVETASEQLLVVKIAADRFAAVRDRIKGLHSYELPEIIAVPIVDGAPDYLAWLHSPDQKP